MPSFGTVEDVRLAAAPTVTAAPSTTRRGFQLLYFAYGSNMLTARIEERLGPCGRLGAACLTGHVLRFHKLGGLDGTGKCDAFPSDDPGDRVWGALLRLTETQLARLDTIEGPGYRRVAVGVTCDEQLVEATMYLAKRETRDSCLRPLDSYKKMVLAGARELDLPADYIAAIEAVPSLPNRG